ncbi:MAG: CAF17-like 4Fe-4S cluster assembly/insertion protein YgfZ [Burkholderiales bacterium]
MNSSPRITDLAHLGFLRVAGEDAGDFLQNLTSNDIRHLDENSAQHNSLCSPKGRMLASFLMFRMDGDYILQMPKEMVDRVKQRLSMYIFRSKVFISKAELAAVGLSGESAQALLERLPQSVMGTGKIDSGIAIKLSDSRFEIVAEPENAAKIIEKLETQCEKSGKSYWDRLEILDAVPVVLPETEGLFVPQMANFELIGGVSFQKGCYPGQEIVTRTHFLGKIKRRMVLAHVDTQIEPSPGEEVYCGEEAVGTVARSAPSPEGGFDILAVIHLENRESEIQLKSGAVLQMMPMPYSLP